jgi:hypothetical protein
VSRFVQSGYLRLLPQPSGFEGVIQVVMDGEIYQRAISKHPKPSGTDRTRQFHAVAANEMSQLTCQDEVFAHFGEVVDFDMDTHPRLHKAFPHAPCSVLVVDATPLADGGRVVQHEVGSSVLQGFVPVTPVPRFNSGPDLVHVLLRNRLHRKPGSFKSIALLLVKANPDDGTVAEGPDQGDASLDFDPVASP